MCRNRGEDCDSIPTKRALAFIGQNHHAASVQNAQQPSACFLRGFPEYHRQLLPQNTFYHLVEVGIHGVDLPAAALLLGLLLPQLLEQGQVLVKIIGVEQQLASNGIFHKVCLVQAAQNAQYKSCAKLPLQIPGGQAIIISYNE